jgi:hypothetical protein
VERSINGLSPEARLGGDLGEDELVFPKNLCGSVTLASAAILAAGLSMRR